MYDDDRDIQVTFEDIKKVGYIWNQKWTACNVSKLILWRSKVV